MSNYHLKYRPNELDQVIGQPHAVSALEHYKKTNDWPHAFLFTGGSGCGKTTLARIIAHELAVDGSGLVEIDAATFNSVDVMRSLIDGLQYANFGTSAKKFIILDECFAKDTLVNTPNGQIPIQLINPGDVVYNMVGKAKVKHKFANKIPLDRVVKVHFGSGDNIICSCDHLFFTDQGWVKAKNLNKQMVVFNFDLRHTSFPNNFGKAQNDSYLSCMRNDIPKQTDGKLFEKGMLQKVCQFITTSISSCSESILLSLSCMSKDFYTPQTSNYTIGVLSGMWQYFGWQQTHRETFRSSEIGCSTRHKDVKTSTPRKMEASFTRSIPTIDFTQSISSTKQFRQSQDYQIESWQPASLDGYKGREWSTHTTTNCFSNSFRVGPIKTNRVWMPSNIWKMASRIFNKNWSQLFRWSWLSTLLQSRYWLPNIQNCSGSRWNWTSVENEYQQRYKERAKTVGIGVDDVEIYQQGSNDKSFESVIGNSERDQGFVILYDLEIDGHPSYYANSCLVHNCHMLSKSAWNALLKSIEEPPSHVYFALCTTDEDKVPDTIKTRCTCLRLKSVPFSDLVDLLSAIAEFEQLPIPQDGLDLIAREALGSPRQALTSLNLCGHATTIEEVKIALETADQNADTIELCRMLSGNVTPSWKRAVALLKRMTDLNPESIRLVVVNYTSKALLNTTGETQAIKLLAVLEAFSKPCNPSEKMAPILLAVGQLLLASD